MTIGVQSGLVIALTAVAVFFTLVGTVGLLRLPDVYTRAHAACKADTLGAGFAVLAVAAHLGIGLELLKLLLLLAFVNMTNPTAAHAIARAALRQNVPIWVRRPDGSGAFVRPDAAPEDDTRSDRDGGDSP